MSQELKDEIKRLFDVTPEDVNSVSYGFKYKNGEKTGQLSIIFGVNQKKPASELKPDEILPQEISLNGVTYVTDVVQNEIPNLQQCYPDPADPNIQRLRGNPSLLKPMRGGQEIIQFPTGWTPSGGGGYNISVGTLGFFAVDNTDNKIVGVTNSHVVCDERVYCDEQNINVANASPYNTCQVRPWTNVDPSNSYFPGALVNDAGAVELAGYNIKRYQPVSNTDTNYVDGALLIMNNDTPPYVDSNSYMVWQPIGTPDYAPYMPFATAAELDNLLVEDPPVYSTGRTTGPKGYTAATDCALKITEIHVNSYVNDNGQLQYWGDCIKYAYEDGSSTPSAGGDSGSAVLAEIGGTRKIIGLLFAGSTNFTLVNRIDRVASALNIRAWDASYSINLNQPSPVYKVCNLALGYGGIDSVVLDGVTYYQAGFTLTTALPTMPPIPSNSPSPTPSPSPSPTPSMTASPTPSPSPTPSESPYPTPSPTPFFFNETYAWGQNSFGELGNSSIVARSSPVLVSTTSWAFPASGTTVRGSIRYTDNTAWSWGNNIYGGSAQNSVINRSSPVQIDGTWNWLQINSTSSGIKTDGTLWAWGFNSSGACGQNNVITAISSPVQIGSDNTWVLSRNVYNNNVTMAIKGDGSLWGVGANAFGQLGDGTAVNRSSIVQSGTGAFWKDIQCGNQYTIGLKYNGTIWGVGINSSGQLGLGNLVNRSSWVQIGSSNDWKIISTSQYPTAAIKNDGTLWTWGNGGAGMGQSSTANFLVPTQVGTGNDWSLVSAGENFMIAIKTNGTLWAWGTNAYGQLGDGTKLATSSPIQIGIDTTWKNVSAGFRAVFAFKTPGTTSTPSPTPSPSATPSPTPIPSATAGYYAYSTGKNSNGQLGIGVAYNVSIPTAINASSTWILVCPSAASSTASGAGIKNDFSLWLWGCATNGQLGNNVGNALINYSSPIQTSLGGFDWISVGLGYRSGWAVKLNGTLWSWGTNANGTIGNNQAAVAYSTPIQIGTDTDWASVYGGNGTTAYALKKDGTLWGWGRNAYGQLGDSTITSKSSPTQIGVGKTFTKFAASGIHCGAVDSTGALWMWGINNNGCLGNENVINFSSMVQTVYATNDWLSVGCGHNNSGRQFTIALKTDGTLWTWGSNNASQLGSGNFTNRSSPAQILGGGTNWTYITAGVQSGFAIKNDNTMWVWGRNQAGELGNNSVASLNSPTQLNFGANDYVLAAAGYDAMMLLKPSYITPQPTPSPLPTSTPTPTPT